MAKRKIIFIRNWGNYKVGDTMKNPTDITIRELCFKHKFGRLEGAPDFEKKIQQEQLTMRKLAEDISFGLRQAEKSVKEDDKNIIGIIEELDEELAPTPPDTQIQPKKKRKKSSTGRKKKK